MNPTIKTILATVVTLSLFTIAMIEISGISRTAIYNKFQKPEYPTSEENSISKQVMLDSTVAAMPPTTFEFEETKFDFGTIKDGDIVKHTYNFTNTGTSPMVISNVIVSCGCTAPSYNKAPVLPGQKGSVTLEFNSSGKGGKDVVSKNALVKCNSTISPYSIGFTANVLPKK
jgi:Protein of unknown function (DUF1573)